MTSSADDLYPMIASSKNDQVKRARRVRDGKESDWIFLEGEHLATEAMRSNLLADLCLVDAASQSRFMELMARLSANNVPVHLTTSSVMASLSDTVTPQGFVLIARRPRAKLDELLLPTLQSKLLPVCDRLQDPGNLGSIIRTAEAAGSAGFITLPGTTDPFSPKALRSSMGSALRLPIAAAPQGLEWIHQAKADGWKVLGTTGYGGTDYREIDWGCATLLLLGHEGQGLHEDLLTSCDATVRIPLASPVESLNVAAAGAILLFEAARSRSLGDIK